MHQMTVRACGVDTLKDLNAFVVGLYDHLDHPSEGLEFQRALEFHPRDAELGQDTYCLLSSQGRKAYGAVVSCVLHHDRLTLKLAPAARGVFGVDGYDLRLDLPDEDVRQLIKGLRSVFLHMRGAPRELVLDA